jgi:hypothetical protein
VILNASGVNFGGGLGDLRGIIGNSATLCSTYRKATKKMAPTTSIAITIGEFQLKYVPPPEMGISNNTIAIAPVRIP